MSKEQNVINYYLICNRLKIINNLRVVESTLFEYFKKNQKFVIIE